VGVLESEGILEVIGVAELLSLSCSVSLPWAEGKGWEALQGRVQDMIEIPHYNREGPVGQTTLQGWL
jgi:hypothetical protein